MKNDRKIEKKVKELQSAVHSWLDYIQATGNQCAYSDRQLEDILDIADAIKKLYDEQGNI